MENVCVHCGQKFISKRPRKMCGPCKISKATQNWKEYKRRGKLKSMSTKG